MAGWQVGIDIGGTFTDVVALHPEQSRLVSAKVKTVAGDPIRSLLAGLKAVGLSWPDVDDLIHGTTVVTNAIIEQQAAKVAFVTTEGFADILAIGRQNRRHLYRLDLLPKLPPQVPSELCFEVKERVDHSGRILEPLSEASVERLISALRTHRVEAVAISLLHSYANAEHERALASMLRQVVPHIALSHRVNPEAREFERASTTVLSAGVMPMVSNYVSRIEAERPGTTRLHFFHSASGLCSPAVLRELPLALALSGPAAGVAAASRIAREMGIGRALTFDMGGTTTDVCLIVNGEPQIAADRALAGRPLRMAAVAVESIGAGGGSLVRFDGTAMSVGPDSAGADPGPACYGLGGQQPTISDADMVLGFLEHGATFGGNIVLDGTRARGVLAPLADKLGLGVEATAAGVVRVANNAMSHALRRVTVEQGIDARSCALIAFGGAGPMHAVEVARLVGIRRVIVPSQSGALSALGCVLSDISYTQHRTIRLKSTQWDAAYLAAVRAEIIAETDRLIAHPAKIQERRWVAAVRYAGQSYAVELMAPPLDEPGELGRMFKERHAELYGFATDEPWEVVALRLTASVPRNMDANIPHFASRSASPPVKEQQCWFDRPVTVRQYQRDALVQNERLHGPLIVRDSMSTLVLPPKSSLMLTRFGHLDIDIGAAL